MNKTFTPFEVRLVEEPDDTSRYFMTVGNVYTVVGLGGSCYITTSDKPGQTVMVWRGRFSPVEQLELT